MSMIGGFESCFEDLMKLQVYVCEVDEMDVEIGDDSCGMASIIVMACITIWLTSYYFFKNNWILPHNHMEVRNRCEKEMKRITHPVVYHPLALG